jgi:MEMO1 family protein
MQGCICPHPPLLIPEIGRGSRDEVAATVRGMEDLARDIGDPETVVVISPHTPGFADVHIVKTAPHLTGDFGAFGCPEVSFSFENDTAFVDLLLALAGGDGGVALAPGDEDILDHGVLVPLSFLRTDRVVSLSIVSPYRPHRALGNLVRRCAEELDRDVLFVASGDLSHRLIPSAPAGYDPRGKAFDEAIVDLMRRGDFAGLASLDKGLVKSAGECGLRSLIGLGGFLGDDAAQHPTVYSYEGPYGVGYLVAGFGASGGRQA